MILDRLRAGCDEGAGQAWTAAADATVVRPHQHAAGARRAPSADVDSARLAPAVLATRCAAGALGSYGAGRRWAGPGGLTSKIHLLANSGCRPLARLTSAGQSHDPLALVPLMGQLKIARRCLGRPRTRPGRLLGDKAYSSAAIRAHLRGRGIEAAIPEPADQVRNRLRRGSRDARPPSTAPPISSATPSSAPSASSASTAPSPPGTTNADYVWRGTVDVASIRIWLRRPFS